MLNYVQVLDVCARVFGSSAGIPSQIAHTIYMVYRAIQILIPILLIIWGMLDLGKAVMAQKEEEIRKGQYTFIKRLIAAIIVFFVVTLVKLVINLFAGGDSQDITDCINSILNCKTNNCVDEVSTTTGE